MYLLFAFGVTVVEGVFYVADTGNPCVLAWTGLPEPDEEPQVVLAQSSATSSRVIMWLLP